MGSTGYCKRVCSNYFPLIDISKLYCACLVVFIHMGFGDSFSVVPCLSRQAVPYFFLVSGFFLYKRLSTTDNARKSVFLYAKNLLVVYFVWTALWLPYTINEYTSLYAGKSIIYVVIVLIRRIFLCGNAPYWYLLVLAEAAIGLKLVIQKQKYIAGGEV